MHSIILSGYIGIEGRFGGRGIVGSGESGAVGGELVVDLADGFFYVVVEVSFRSGDDILDAENAGDGGGGEAEDAEGVGKLIEIGLGVAGFDQATGEDTDEGDLVDEGFEVGGLDAGEITLFDAAGVEAMLEGIEVAARGAGMAVLGG